MKDEIKEILELYKNEDIEYYNLVSDLGYDKLLDYITNLQEENNNLLEENERLNKDLDTSIEICNNRQKEIVRLNNIIDELEKDLEKNYIRWEKYAKTHKEDAWRMIICKYYLDKLKELKEGKIDVKK